MTRFLPLLTIKTLIGCACLVLSGMPPAKAQSPQEHWRVIRGNTDLTVGVTGIRATDDGHFIAVGAYYSPDYKSGISVSKLRVPDGSLVWRSELPITKLPSFASVQDFAVDPGGNAYVISTHRKGSVIAKFLASGKVGWKKNLKGTPSAIAIDSQGNPAIYQIEGSLKPGFSSAVTKYSSAKGAVLWKAKMSQPRPRMSAPDLRGIEFDASGNLILALASSDGQPSRCLKLEASKGRLAWQRQLNLSSGDVLGIGPIAVAPGGDVVVFASRPVDALSQWSFTAKLAGADGSSLWSNEQLTTSNLLHMGFDPTGRLDRVYRSSKLSNSYLIVSKSDADTGNAIWSTQNLGVQAPSTSLMSVDSGPNGEIALLTNSGAEAWVHLVSPSGTLVWGGPNRPQDLSLQVEVPYQAGLMNQKQVVALEGSVVMACSRTNYQTRQHDFAKYGTPLPGKLVVRTADGEDWQDGSSYHLGDVAPRSYDYFPVTIRNGGDGDLVLSNFGVFFTRRIDAYSGDEFKLEGNGASRLIPPGGETEIVIRFLPKEAGLCTAVLEMKSSDPDLPSIAIPLSGRGMGPRQEFEDWAVAQGMSETVSPDHVPHGDGIPLLLKFAFNLDPGRPDHQLMKRDTGLAGLPLVTFEKRAGTNEMGFRIEYVKRRNTKVTYRPVRALEINGTYQSVNFSDLKVTPINADWERVTGWCQRGYDNPAREFVRVEVTF